MTPAERARLRALRESSGLSYPKLAERAGLDTMQLYKILSGDNDNPKVETLRKVVLALGGTMAEIFEDSHRDGP